MSKKTLNDYFSDLELRFFDAYLCEEQRRYVLSLSIETQVRLLTDLLEKQRIAALKKLIFISRMD